MQLDWPILSVLIWLPIAGGAVMLALGERGVVLGRWVALLDDAVTFGISTLLRCTSTPHGADAVRRGARLDRHPGHVVSTYSLGVDGISMALIGLTTLTTPLVVIGAGR